MQITTSMDSTNPYLQNNTGIDTKDTDSLQEKIKNGEISAKSISDSYLIQYSLTIESYASDTLQTQSSILDFTKIKDILKSIDFEAIGYSGKAIGDLKPEEAKELIGENGYFGVSQTSERLSDFVLKGGGDDLERLRAGREGILRGFNEAEKIWGDKLPDISYETLEKALAKIDEKIISLGGNVLDTTA